MIAPRATIHLTVTQEKPVLLTVHEPDEITLTAENGAGQVRVSDDIPTYMGAYEVTPSSGQTVLKTAQKKMRDDVTVHPIPYYDVTNKAGGRTIYISSDIERS